MPILSFFSFYSIAINAPLAPLVIVAVVVVTDAAAVVAVAVVVDDDDDDDDNDNVDRDVDTDTDPVEEDSDDDSEDEDDTDSSNDDLGPVPTPEEVELEYTYPNDFEGRTWEDVVERGRFFRLIIDPSCTEIGKTFWCCNLLIELVFPKNTCAVTRILNYAFSDCENLQRTINGLPRGLVELGFSAFELCGSLAGELVLPSSVRIVRKSCFRECNSLTSIVFEASTDAVELDVYVFAYCTGITTVTLPLNLREILPVGCLQGCTSLMDTALPNTVKVLGLRVFKGCTSLRTMDLRENKILFIPVSCE